MKIFHLSGKVQNYDWGKIGEKSKVAQLIKANDPNFLINSELPYAELWMGTHPNGESVIKNSQMPLSKWIENNDKMEGQLSFLFKVLSIRKALSIQCHPNKEEAMLLNSLKPSIYKDSNHKPELAIALTKFKAMCGFRQYNEVKEFLMIIPELRLIIGEEIVKNFLAIPSKDTLKACFQSLMSAETSAVNKYLQEMKLKFSTEQDIPLKLQRELFLNLIDQFPNDTGVLCIYFLNVINLDPGEAMYLCPNIPHAYISGDCVECMACSDNVIRAGLTPKYKDVETLIRILDYRGYAKEELIFKPISKGEYLEVFKPPVPDFSVTKITIPFKKHAEIDHICHSHSIVIVISGKAHSNIGPLEEGMIMFISKNEKLHIEKAEDTEFILYQAMSA